MSDSDVKPWIGFHPEEMSTLVNENVITQHAENASFLWLQRDEAATAPHYNLKDLINLDERVEANLDGLRIAGDAGWRISAEQLEFGEAGEIFTAMALALERNDERYLQSVLDIAYGDPELERAVISAFGWLEFNTIEHMASRFINSNHPGLIRIGIAAYAIHRVDPCDMLASAIRHPEDRVRARALKAAGELGRIDLLSQVINAIENEKGAGKFWAAWSAALLGSRSSEVLKALKDVAVSGEKYADRAMDLMVRCLESNQAKTVLSGLKKHPQYDRLFITGAGALGDPEFIPDLFPLMENPDVSRKAGEAFSLITGMDLSYHDLEQDEALKIEDGQSENPEDEDVDPDEDLPWPSSQLIVQRWQTEGAKYRRGVRYLSGKPMDDSQLAHILRTGIQRQRVSAALEMSLCNTGTPLFETRNYGRRQMRMLYKQ